MKKHLQTETDTLLFAHTLAQTIEAGIIIYFYGSLGAGKTTFVRGILQGLGYQGKVKSPTYTLIEPYQIGSLQIFHFDLFRLTDAKDLVQIGFEEYFLSSAICLIEWPEKGMPFLPPPDLACYIEFVDEAREMDIRAFSPRGEQTLKKIKE